MNSAHEMPWPTCAAIGPGQAAEMPQPSPNIRLPKTCRRSGDCGVQWIGASVSTARERTRRRMCTPAVAVPTAAANIRNR